MLIEFIDYQVTNIEASYLAIKTNYLTEEIRFLNDKKTTNEELIQLKKEYLRLIIEWVDELTDMDSKLLKHYYFDGMILENIASLLSINHGVVAKKHPSIMKRLNNNHLLNKFPYKKAPLYSEYLITKELEEEQGALEKLRKYNREYIRSKQTKKY